MQKFRKKPVVIEAVQLTLENSREVMQMVGGRYWSKSPTRMVTGIIVPTLEGEHQASFGDWIIRGIKGEYYPCKPDIFDATYEPAPTEIPK
jgi:hypothetical protein